MVKLLAAKINKHLSENHDTTLARDLKVPIEVVDAIAYIRIEDLSDLDQAKESDRFIVTVETFDQEVLTRNSKRIGQLF